MDAGYYTGKLYGQAFNVIDNNGARTTAIKFIGVEDLGGGLKAKFQFEADPSITANDKNLFTNASMNGSNLTITTSGSVTTATGTQSTLYTANGTAQGSNNAATRPWLALVIVMLELLVISVKFNSEQSTLQH